MKKLGIILLLSVLCIFARVAKSSKKENDAQLIKNVLIITDSGKAKRKEAYEKAHEIRKFEIEVKK